MEVMNVYILYTDKFTIDAIKKDLYEEGYDHNFMFGFEGEYFGDFIKDNVDEVWCFGDCTKLRKYKIAKEVGADIWQMK